MTAGLSYCAEEVRRHDRDRFLTTLFAPGTAREDYCTVLAFNLEIARTREVVSEPLLGEIRLQWWRDAVTAAYADDVRTTGHQVLDPLTELIRRARLPEGLIQALIDGRGADLSEEPIADEAELETYADGTAGALNRLLAAVAAPQSDPDLIAQVTEAGVIWGMTGILRRVGFDARQGRILLPTSLFKRHDVDPHDLFGGQMSPGLQAGLGEMADAIRARATAFRANPPPRNGAVRSLFMQVSLANMYIGRLRRLRYDVFGPDIEGGRAGRQMRLAFSALWGRY